MLKKLLIVGIVLVLATMPILAVAAPAPPTTSLSINAQDGEVINLPGLDGEVIVHYDSFDIPHIYATTDHDLYMVQGYLHATNRWWQMEWSRHQAYGRLSEIMGENLLGSDIFLRSLRLQEYAEQDYEVISDEYKALLQAYSDGVNAYLEGKTPEEAAIEYRFVSLLGAELELEPWTPLDTLSFAQAIGISFEQSNIQYELIRAGVLEAAGPIGALLITPAFDYRRDPIVTEPGWTPPNAENDSSNLGTTFEWDDTAFTPFTDFAVETDWFVGSNSWVVSGELTDTGFPMLANDPHISQNNPSVWIQQGLHCIEMTDDCTLNTYGYIFPGSPGILIGHNDHISWGLTVNGLDTIDLYRLELNPDNDLQYLYDGEYRDIEIIMEEIIVAGQEEPVMHPILMTHFGPLINELVGIEDPIAARMVAAEPSASNEVVYRVPQATNWDEFQAGWALFTIAGQNAVYADVEGNIGLIATGRIPMRVEGHDPSVPQDGTGSAFEWQGFVDPYDNPRLFNPETGYIVAANNAIARPESYPFVFGTYYNFGERAARIETLIQETDVMTIDRMAEIQTDNFNTAAQYIVPMLLDMDFEDDRLNAARDFLGEWDYMNDADSAGAVMFNSLWMYLVPMALDELEAIGGESGGTLAIFIMRDMALGEHPLWVNESMDTNDPNEIVAAALDQAISYAEGELGEDWDAWRWDAVHVSFPQHTPLGQLPAGVSPSLDVMINDIYRLFNRKYGVDGGLESVNNQRWDVRNGNHMLDGSIVSMRMIIDFSDMNNSRFISELGVSGDPNSVHFDDLSPLWATGQYIPYAFDVDAVEALTERTEVFAP